ncbi:hypothetical protein [Ramlibacter rhizophilus]|uniref:Uncharacterized protein n=1 Tax=Ramlibacter rhizophilus TaxID=1781167 RepID=A0A4Z0BVU9_9BURK|nr:hypothetical protein [Ramlibacter rhizophilus]TFZ03447.1 hypothetical protein EZ242_06115 [Ramlibacter rhizophilus]
MNSRILLVSLTAAAATVALAGNPHFIRADGSINADGGYVANFKEAGLGANQNISYVLSAGPGTRFTYQCYTRSHNTPQGEPNHVFPSTLQTGGTFNSGKNGQITASLTLVPSPDDDCQGGGLKLCLVSVSYVGVVLRDTSTPTETQLPSLSRDFLDSQNRPTNCEPF